jgi:urea carboxylase-associated protein 2
MPTYSHDIPGGAAWTIRLPRYHELRLEALGDDPNVSMLIYAASDPLERLNVPDTLKSQMSGCVRPPMVLMSDMGRALVSVTGSSLGWHDAISGHSLDRHVPNPSTFAASRNDRRRSARALFLDELAKLGLGERDLHASVNFFSKVAIAPDGALTYVPAHATSGDHVQLRAEQDLTVVMATSPHPRNGGWQPSPVRASIRGVPAPGADDPSRIFRAESARALEQAERVAA